MESARDPQGQEIREIHAEAAATGSASASPTYVTVKATADRLGVSRITVYRRFHAGLFPGRQFGRSIKILGAFVDDLDAEIKSGQPVDVEEYAATWTPRISKGVA